MSVPTYDEFVKHQAQAIADAYRQRHGHDLGITDMAHNLYRLAVEGWTFANVIHDIKGEPLEDGGAPNSSDGGKGDEPVGVPPRRGPFAFQAPYNARAVRVTDERDGRVYPCGYSYWSRVNNHRGLTHLLVLAGLANDGPTIFEVNKSSHEVQAKRALFFRGTSWAADEADQWYFSATDPYGIFCCHGNDFCRVDAIGGRVDVVFTSIFGASLFQPHSSDDGRTHSATVKDADYQAVGCMVEKDGAQKFYPRQGDYDECQVDASGRWLLIKENDDNRIVDLETGRERVVKNADGALGHSDCGWGFAVGEDDMHDPPGRCVKMDFATGQQSLVYELTQWKSGLGHVAVRGDRALISNAHRENLPRVNDLLLVLLDGSMQSRAVAPNLVDLNASGGGDDYKKQPMANLDPLGEYACWSANHGSDRLDIFIVKL